MIESFDSARLRMRPLRADDVDAFHPSWSDPEFMRYLISPPHGSIEDSRTYIAERLVPTDWSNWVITRSGEDRPLGTVGYDERRPGVAEIGYTVLREHWGQGIGREAVTGLIDLLFDQGMRRVFADTDPDNAGSNALIEKLGFTLEGRLRHEWETHIGVRDAFIWGMLRDEWPAKRPT